MHAGRVLVILLIGSTLGLVALAAPATRPSRPVRVVFVCDASGSMWEQFDKMRVELRQGIEGLQREQSFNIIFFRDGGCIALSPRGLLVADEKGKREAYAFIDDTVPRGSSEPMAALGMAFNQRPNAIYFLSDGDFADRKALMRFIHTKNGIKAIKIHTIGLMAGDAQPNAAERMELLEEIAKDNNGTFRRLGEPSAAQE